MDEETFPNKKKLKKCKGGSPETPNLAKIKINPKISICLFHGISPHGKIKSI